jgi:hypothetical protein
MYFFFEAFFSLFEPLDILSQHVMMMRCDEALRATAAATPAEAFDYGKYGVKCEQILSIIEELACQNCRP